MEQARKANEAQLEAARALPAAYLREVFESDEAKAWPTRLLGEYILSARNGFGRRPSGEEDGPIVLRLADVSTGAINIQSPRRVNMTAEEKELYRLDKGDILFVRVNGSADFIGRCIIVDQGYENISFNDHLIRVKLDNRIFYPFLQLAANQHSARDYLVKVASTSAGQLTINQTTLSQLEIPVPPIEVQEDIVSRTREKQDLANQLIKKLESEFSDILALPATLLRQAFTGAV